MNDAATRMLSPCDCVCGLCRKPITRGDEALWWPDGTGLYHPACGKKLKLDITNPDEDLGDTIRFTGEHTILVAPAAAKCFACGTVMGRGETIVWARGLGVFHPDCLGVKGL